MSRRDKRVHYQAMLDGTASKHSDVRLAGWSNFTAGYQVTLMPTDCPIIIKTKPTDPVGNLFASAEKWQPFARRFFDLRPDAHACYLVDASGICATANGNMELQEISKTQALGEASRPIRNVVSRLNPRHSTIVAAGGLPALLALKMAVFCGFPCVADIIRRIVLFLPSAPERWEKSLLKGMKTAWESQAGTSMKKIPELVIVTASAQESKTWSTASLDQVNPHLSAFFGAAFSKISVESLPAIGGNPLVHFANMLFKNPSSSSSSSIIPLPPNRVPDLGIYEIRFMLSKYTKHVEQEVDMLSMEYEEGVNKSSEDKIDVVNNDDDDDDANADGEDETQDQNDEQKQASSAAAATSSAVTTSVSAPIVVEPVQVILAQLTQLFDKNKNTTKSIPVRLAGLVMDAEGNIGNAHGIVQVVPSSSSSSKTENATSSSMTPSPLTSFIGRMVKMIVDASFENGKLILSSPRQILRVSTGEKESLQVVSNPSNVPPISHSTISRRYGCVLMRGRKIVLTRESPSSRFMKFPSDTRQDIHESPIECASRAICSQLDVTSDNFTILSDLPPVVTFEKVVNFLNPKESETIITTLFLAVTIQCPGGAARDGIEEEMTLEDTYDWVTYAQAEKFLETEEELKALTDASKMIRRAADEEVNLFSWPEGFGLLGDAARPFNDTVCAFVHTPFLDASAEAAAKSLSSVFESLPVQEVNAEILASSSNNTSTKRPLSSVLSTFLTKKVVEASSVAKHCAKSNSHVTLVPLPTSLSFADAVYDVAPSVKKRNWAESRQVTVLAPSKRVLAAFDGSEEDVDVVAVAEDVLEHSDEIIVVIPTSSASNNNTKKQNDDDNDENDSDSEITKTLLALLHARKNKATAVWTARQTSNNNNNGEPLLQIQPEFSKKILSSWIRPPNTVRDPGPRYSHPSVVSVRPGGVSCNSKPLNPITLSHLASEEMVDVIRKMKLVHVHGTVWVAGCQTHPVRMSLRGGSDWNFSKADKPFSTPQPCHDLEMIFCPVSGDRSLTIQREVEDFFSSLQCRDGESFMNESELEILPGWSAHGEGEEEEAEDDE